MRVEQPEEDIYVMVGETYRSNTVAFVNDEEVLLVDCLASRKDAESLRDFIEGGLKKRVRFIISTHYFRDHMAGLKLFPDAHRIAHRNYMHTFASEKYFSPEEENHFVEPDILISDGMLMKWGRYHLDVFYNPGHTMSTLSVDVPEADLLIAGDTVVGNIAYLYYSAPEVMVPALKRLEQRGRGRLVSSHMGVRSPDAIGNALFYVKSLGESVNARRRSGEAREAILGIELESCMREGVGASDFEKIFHKRNLETVLERNLFAHTSA